jgi:3-hydroxyacyl-[acyl-carrier-protein] dehydratase
MPAPGDLRVVGVPAFAAPLRAVDQVGVDTSGGTTRIVATKAIVSTDPYLPGHFPGFTVFPGVFLIEAVRQAVAAALCSSAEKLCSSGQEEPGRVPDIVEVRSVRFLAPLLPGDVVTIDARADGPDGDGQVEVAARCFRADGVTAARMKLRFGWPPC